MTAAVADTSIWIGFLRNGTAAEFVRRGLQARSLLLASVVAHELYLGVIDRVEKRELDRICTAFTVENLTVTPSFEDWGSAGVLLHRYGRVHGAVEARTHLNDVLIVLSAAARRAMLVTWNVGDMGRWNGMLPRHRQVRVTTPHHADRFSSRGRRL